LTHLLDFLKIFKNSWMISSIDSNANDSEELICNQSPEHQQEKFHQHFFNTDPPFFHFPYDQLPSTPDEDNGHEVEDDEKNEKPANRDCWEEKIPIRHPRDLLEAMFWVDTMTTSRRSTSSFIETTYPVRSREYRHRQTTPVPLWTLPICREPVGLIKLLSRCENDMELLVEVRLLTVQYNISFCLRLVIYFLVFSENLV
jgi:hypothetical protein